MKAPLGSYSVLVLLISSLARAQDINVDWYSEYTYDSITIQNSYPKGGPYTGPITEYYNYSYLVFFSRVINETGNPKELSLDFSADSIPIPNSPDTFVKLFLPTDTMTMEKTKPF